MGRSKRIGRIVRRCGAFWLLSVTALAGTVGSEDGSGPLPADVANQTTPGDQGGMPHAVAGFEGVASPGLRIELRGGDSTGNDLSYRWFQAWGPEALVDNAETSEASLVVPRGIGTLVFVLVVRNAEGLDTATVRVPIQWQGQESTPDGLVADAGDDLRAVVGRQVTLNGVRSVPRGSIGYRWVQVGGPRVALAIEDGYVYTFVPDVPGSYRFALLVASGSAIAPPDYVRIEVEDEPALGNSAEATTDRGLDRIAVQLLEAVDGAPRTAEALGLAFEGVADRAFLYDSFDAMARELSQRLDAVLPPSEADRALWASRVFEPLSAAMLNELRGRGLDLARPEVRAATLSGPQREVLAKAIRGIAKGFRSTLTPVTGRDVAATPSDFPGERAPATPTPGRDN